MKIDVKAYVYPVDRDINKVYVTGPTYEFYKDGKWRFMVNGHAIVMGRVDATIWVDYTIDRNSLLATLILPIEAL